MAQLIPFTNKLTQFPRNQALEDEDEDESPQQIRAEIAAGSRKPPLPNRKTEPVYASSFDKPVLSKSSVKSIKRFFSGLQGRTLVSRNGQSRPVFRVYLTDAIIRSFFYLLLITLIVVWKENIPVGWSSLCSYDLNYNLPFHNYLETSSDCNWNTSNLILLIACGMGALVLYSITLSVFLYWSYDNYSLTTRYAILLIYAVVYVYLLLHALNLSPSYLTNLNKINYSLYETRKVLTEKYILGLGNLSLTSILLILFSTYVLAASLSNLY